MSHIFRNTKPMIKTDYGSFANQAYKTTDDVWKGLNTKKEDPFNRTQPTFGRNQEVAS